MSKIHIALILIYGLSVSGCGGSDSDDVVTASDKNAPVLSTIGDQAVRPGETLQIIVSAMDADDDNLSFGVEGDIGPYANPFASNPPATFDTLSGRFEWIPVEAQTGNYSVRFSVTDNSSSALTDLETITITVQDQLAFGASLYIAHCESCHGVEGRGGNESLVAGAELLSIEDAIENVSRMNQFRLLTDAEVEAIHAYLAQF